MCKREGKGEEEGGVSLGRRKRRTGFLLLLCLTKVMRKIMEVWEKRIDNANLALSRCQDKDMKKYWTRVVKTLLRKSKQKLN